MLLKREHSPSWKLYCITVDKPVLARPLAWSIEQAILGGADVIQLRNKKDSDESVLAQARVILEVTRRHGVPLIINDRLRVAKLCGAEGVHLGQDDGSLRHAREELGERVLLGRSTHSPEQILAAQSEGFDYLGVGPVFSTPTKPMVTAVGLDLVRFAAANARVPFVAIGGIDSTNIRDVLGAGARAVAVVRAVFGALEPRKEAEKLCRQIQ